MPVMSTMAPAARRSTTILLRILVGLVARESFTMHTVARAILSVALPMFVRLAKHGRPLLSKLLPFEHDFAKISPLEANVFI